jgi:lysozyme
MDLERLRAHVQRDEGTRLQVYADSRGLPTVGVGHRVTPADQLRLGDWITPERCARLFDADLDRTIAGCVERIAGWEIFPEEVQTILLNMAFNLGVEGLLTFRRMLAHVRAQEYPQAAASMQQSKWCTQVGQRAVRLVAQMRLVPLPGNTTKEES